jgi:hypothetical protein
VGWKIIAKYIKIVKIYMDNFSFVSPLMFLGGRGGDNSNKVKKYEGTYDVLLEYVLKQFGIFLLQLE